MVGNHPSASCCCRHCASSCTTFASCRVIEIRDRGIVEGEMPVLSDAEQAELRMGGAKRLAIFARGAPGIGSVPVHLVECSHSHLAGQPLAQVSAEGAGVIGGQADVFVHVETGHSIPGEILDGCERGESRELGCAGGEDDGDRLASGRNLRNSRGCGVGSGLPSCFARGMNFNFHPLSPKLFHDGGFDRQRKFLALGNGWRAAGRAGKGSPSLPEMIQRPPAHGMVQQAASTDGRTSFPELGSTRARRKVQTAAKRHASIRVDSRKNARPRHVGSHDRSRLNIASNPGSLWRTWVCVSIGSCEVKDCNSWDENPPRLTPVSSATPWALQVTESLRLLPSG